MLTILSTMESSKYPVTTFKSEYIRRIAQGFTESVALKSLNVDWLDFFEMLADDPQFRKDIDEARKHRAEVWIARIAESVDAGNDPLVPPPSASEIPAMKLEFEKLKFLAGADNPERYGNAAKTAKVDVSVDFKQFQLLPPKEALRVLQEDPFKQPIAIDGVVVEPKE